MVHGSWFKFHPHLTALFASVTFRRHVNEHPALPVRMKGVRGEGAPKGRVVLPDIMKITAIKGMSDVLPPDSFLWREIEEKARKIFDTYGFEEIRTPIVEPTELFVRSVGETSAIVEKEMYTFEDKKGVSLTLRPEGTAPVVRAYIENGMYAKDPIAKLYYFGPMFRYEQPQKGRSRQFFQIGAELLGAESPLADAEMLILLHQLFQGFGISDARFEINSLGCKTCRPKYLGAIHQFLKGKEEKFCDDCQKRSKKNPLRILDCKKEGCRKLTEAAPVINDYWCEACSQHYREVRGLLLAGHVKFKENPRIIRGLDYYCRTAFEVLCDDLGSQNAVAAGGRYDGLIQELDGPDLPGIGFAIGVERVLLACDCRVEEEGNFCGGRLRGFAEESVASCAKVGFQMDGDCGR